MVYDGWRDGWTDGEWMGRWTGGWKDRRMEKGHIDVGGPPKKDYKFSLIYFLATKIS